MTTLAFGFSVEGEQRRGGGERTPTAGDEIGPSHESARACLRNSPKLFDRHVGLSVRCPSCGVFCGEAAAPGEATGVYVAQFTLRNRGAPGGRHAIRRSISCSALVVALMLSVLAAAHDARAAAPPPTEATPSTPANSADPPPPAESGAAPAEESGTPEGEGTPAPEQPAESSVTTSPEASCTDLGTTATSGTTATADRGAAPAEDSDTSEANSTPSTEQQGETSGNASSGANCTSPSTEVAAEDTATAQESGEGSSAVSAAPPCPTDSPEAPKETPVTTQEGEAAGADGPEATCAGSSAPIPAEGIASAAQPAQAPAEATTTAPPEPAQAPGESTTSAAPSPAPGGTTFGEGAAAPRSGEGTPPVPSEGTAAEPAGLNEEAEASDVGGELSCWFSSQGFDDANSPIAFPERAVTALTIGATALGGGAFQGTPVSRFRAKRAARAARVMIAPSRLPDRPVPHAPSASAGLGGTSTGSGSVVRDFAALAPGSTQRRPDLVRRLLGREATQRPAAFVSPLERPG